MRASKTLWLESMALLIWLHYLFLVEVGQGGKVITRKLKPCFTSGSRIWILNDRLLSNLYKVYRKSLYPSLLLQHCHNHHSFINVFESCRSFQSFIYTAYYSRSLSSFSYFFRYPNCTRGPSAHPLPPCSALSLQSQRHSHTRSLPMR